MQPKSALTRLAMTMLVVASCSVPLHAGETPYTQALRGTGFILTPTGSGTGWIVDRERGLMLTNEHVVANHQKVFVIFPEYNKTGQPIAEMAHYVRKAERIRAEVIDADRQHDLALIRLLDKLPDNVTALKPAPQEPKPGERVHSVGNPSASGALWIYSTGDVRQVYQKEWKYADGSIRSARVLEMQSPINSGDSGSPVVNQSGEVVGVVSGKSPDADLMSWCIAVTEVHAYLKEAIPLVDPKTADLFEQRGIRAMARGQAVQALEDFTSALRLNPKSTDILIRRAMANRDRRDYDLALDDLADAIKLDPQHEGAFNVRGCVYTDRGEYDNALKDFRRAIQLNPKMESIHANRAIAHSKKGEIDQAVHCYDEALRLAPHVAEWYYQRGLLLEQRGKLELAENDFNQAVQRDAGYKAQLNLFKVKAIRVVNQTKHKIRVYLQYEGVTKDGKLAWLPGQGVLSWELAPGEASALAQDNHQVLARRMRIWADSPDSNLNWLKVKDTDTWTAPAAGYRGGKLETYTYTFTP